MPQIKTSSGRDRHAGNAGTPVKQTTLKTLTTITSSLIQATKSRVDDELQKRKQELPTEAQAHIKKERNRQQKDQRVPVLHQNAEVNHSQRSPALSDSSSEDEESMEPYGATYDCPLLGEIVKKRQEPESVIMLEKNKIERLKKKLEKKKEALENAKEINIEYSQKLKTEDKRLSDWRQALEQKEREFWERKEQDEQELTKREKDLDQQQNKLKMERQALAEVKDYQRQKYSECCSLVDKLQENYISQIKILRTDLELSNPDK